MASLSSTSSRYWTSVSRSSYGPLSLFPTWHDPQ
jgi:hypothetical protein